MALLRSALLLLALLLVVFLANKELAGVDAVTEGQYHLDRAGGHGSGSLKGFHNQGIELTLAAPSEAHFPLSSLVTSLSSALSLFSTLTLSLSLYPVFLSLTRGWWRTECGGQCVRRCSRTQYKKPCLFFCNKCCAKCLCVPPGFYGNKGVCPCYNNWKTKRGGPKCP